MIYITNENDKLVSFLLDASKSLALPFIAIQFL